MANPEHLALLKQAVGVWNKWRYENLDIVVERFDSERCYNNPDEVVQEFFKMIEIGYS